MTTLRTFAVMAVAAVLVVACSPTDSKDQAGASNSSGVTPIPAGPVEPTPTAASPKIPDSQQTAHDTVMQYLQRTVDGLPAGTTLDSTGAQGAFNLSCDDDYTGPGSGPTDFSVVTNVIPPAGLAPVDLVAKTGDLWRSWGLTVMERSGGFEKPNQFGYPPDGYHLMVEAAYPADYPPQLTVISPCFSGDLRRDGIPVPTVIRQTSPAG